jgi:hypothetical protein
MQAAASTHAPTLDEAERLWHSLCVERDAADAVVNQYTRETLLEGESLDVLYRLVEARQRVEKVRDAMLKFLDALDLR